MLISTSRIRPARAALQCLALAAALFLAFLTPAHAQSLDQAKNQGMVCEQPTGFLQATGSASPEVKKMIQDINNRRRAEYARIAEEHGVTPKEVGILTAKKLGPKC